VAADCFPRDFLKPDLATELPVVCFLTLFPLFTRAMASLLETKKLTKQMKMLFFHIKFCFVVSTFYISELSA